MPDARRVRLDRPRRPDRESPERDTVGGVRRPRSRRHLARVDRWHAEAIVVVAAADARGESLIGFSMSFAGRARLTTTCGCSSRPPASSAASMPDPAFPARRAVAGSEPIRASAGSVARSARSAFVRRSAGFTMFSENWRDRGDRDAQRVLGGRRPGRRRAGGTIEHFAGDGIMTIFKPPATSRPRPPRGAGRAADPCVVAAPVDVGAGWPMSRIGIKHRAGGRRHVGAAGRHSFATIGDTTNTAARLMAAGEPGQDRDLGIHAAGPW